MKIFNHKLAIVLAILIASLFFYGVSHAIPAKIVVAPQGKEKVISALTQAENALVTKALNRQKMSRAEVSEYIGVLNSKLREGEIDITNCTGTLLQKINKALLTQGC